MKTAISLPDELFAELERYVTSLGTTRSAFIADAVRARLARLAGESLRGRIDAAVEVVGTDDAADAAVAAGRRRLASGDDDW